MAEATATTRARAGVARSSAVMAAGTLVSRVLGFARNIALLVAVGAANNAADAFTLANNLPNQATMLIAGGVLNAILVPQLVRAMRRADGGREYTDKLLTLALVVMLVLTALLTAGAPWLVRLMANDGWSPDQLALATAFAYWCLPQIMFYGVYTLLGQVLNAHGSFGPYMWAPVANNVIALAGLVWFIALFGPGNGNQHARVADWTPHQITVLAGTATLGVAVQALVLLFPLARLRFVYRPRFGWRGVGLGRAGRVASWTFAAVAVSQLSFWTTSQVISAPAAARAAGTIPADAIVAGNTVYANSYLVFMLPHSLAAVSIVTALFTRISGQAASGDVRAVRRDFGFGMRAMGLFTMLSMAGLIVLCGQIGWSMTSGPAAGGVVFGEVLAAMALGLPFFSVVYLCERVFYAFEDARTPFWIQCVTSGIQVTGNLVVASLVPVTWMVFAVAVTMSVGSAVGALLALTLLRRRLGGTLDAAETVSAYARLGVAALAAGIAGGLLLWWLWDLAWGGVGGALLTLLVVGPVMVAVYAAVALALRVTALTELLAPLLRRVRRA